MSNVQKQNAIATHEPTREELIARIAELEKQQAASRVAGKLTLKVSEKGALSVYGLQRWPVTLYGEQWARLLAEAKTIMDFMVANKASLSVKAQQ